MKKSFLLVLLCMVASVLPAQKKMYVWQGETPTEFEVLAVDSVTFADALPTPVPTEPVFSVSAGKQVQFSCGNLQYTQSTKTWSFAAQQYDFIGTDNVLGGDVTHNATYGDDKSGTALADKIDLFGWSGSTATAQWGIGTSTDNNNYSGDFADWGQNIGNGTTWRTLTKDEWTYILSTRTNASTLKGVARIQISENEYANGLILLPDNWTAPAGVTFKSGNASSNSIQTYADKQTFSLEQWRKLETAGAVFLPASSFRNGSDVNYVQHSGGYWSATPSGLSRAYYLGFRSNYTGWYNNDRYFGQAVRLVKDVR